MSWLGGLIKGINWALYPILIIALSAGAIYAVILGVNLARAETSEKREEAKKRLMWAIIGVVSIFIIIMVVELVMTNLPNILNNEDLWQSLETNNVANGGEVGKYWPR